MPRKPCFYDCKTEGPPGPIWCTQCGHDPKCCNCDEDSPQEKDMTEFKGTPGSWRLYRCRKDGEFVYFVRADDTRYPDTIAEVKTEADATLVKTAPDLLKACRAVLDFAEQDLYALSDRGESRMLEAFAKVRAAVEKATA